MSSPLGLSPRGAPAGSASPRPNNPVAVVVAGEALVDLTPGTSTDGEVAFVPRAGGSCLNVAVGLGRQGVSVALLSRLSTDVFGELLRSELQASDVRSEYLMVADDPSAIVVASVDRDGMPAYAIRNCDAADKGLRPEHLGLLADGGELPPGAALHFGSMAMCQEPQASTIEGLVFREAGRRLISFDPNIRGSVIEDADRYRERMTRWLACCDLVKVSTEDLAWLAPKRSPQEVAWGWVNAGPALVVVTDGNNGAWAFVAGQEIHVEAPQVEVVDTIGAGDAFSAGMLTWLHDRRSLGPEAVRSLSVDDVRDMTQFAIAIASDTCTRPGAQPPWREADA